MSTHGNSNTSSSSPSSRNKNLLAAKSALGLDGSTGSGRSGDAATVWTSTGRGSESAYSRSRSAVTTSGSSSPRHAIAAAPSSHGRVPWLDDSGSSSRTGRSSISSRGGGGGEKYSSSHALSDAARSEARRRREGSSVGDYSAKECKLSRSSFTAPSVRGVRLTPSSPPSQPTFPTSKTHQRDSSSSASSATSSSMARVRIGDAGTLEEGSEVESLTGGRKVVNDTDGTFASSSNFSKSSMSSTIFNSYYEKKKIFYGEGEKGSNLKNEACVGARGTGVRRKKFGDGRGSLLSMQEEEGYYAVDEDSSNSLSIGANAPSTANSQSSAQFGEMRSLLMAITPMQLEELMIQLFGDGDDSSNHDSFLSGQGWKHTLKKSRTLKFCEDTCLAKMGLPEIKRYASDKDISGIEECTSIDEAIDLITLEFERLVSSNVGLRRITDTGMDDDSRSDGFRRKSHDDNIINLDGSMQESIVSDTASNDSSNNSSNYSELVEGRRTLQRSLQACTLPELRLIVERLNLHHLKYDANNKSELIMTIENSMLPGINLSLPSGETSRSLESSQFSNQSSLQRRPLPVNKQGGGDRSSMVEYSSGDSQGVTDDDYYSNNDQSDEFSDDDSYDNSYPDQDSDQEQLYHRKVKFAMGVKEDKSHLAPKREKSGSWRSFVIFRDDAATVDDGKRALVLRDGVDDDMNEKSGKRRRYIRFGPPMPTALKSLGGSTSALFKCCTGISLLLIIALVVGLSVGLTKKDHSESDDLSNSFTTDSGDPVFQSLLRTEIPSARPTAGGSTSLPVLGGASGSPSLSLIAGATSVVASFTFPTRLPDEFFSTSPLTLSTSPTGQIASSPNTIAPVDAIIRTNGPASETPATDPTRTNGPTHAAVTTTHPTSPEIYPLIGPVDESGMRMILYGVSSFTHPGRTQYTMLTAAYIEKFFNTDKKGDDGVQNIVYDVVAGIVIESEELLGPGDSGNSRRELQGGLAVTFTLTLSYHTFSETIDVSTIANRPFFDDAMRSDYVDFMIAGGAASYIGNILSVSPIFYGDDIPNTTFITTTSILSHSPSQFSEIEEIPMTASPTYLATPGPSVEEVDTAEPSPYLAFIEPPVEDVTTPQPEPPLEDVTTSEPSTFPVMLVTLEPTPSNSMQIITSDPMTSPPTTSMGPSSMPSDGTIPVGSLYVPTTTPTYSPLDVIVPEDDDDATMTVLTPNDKSIESATVLDTYSPVASPKSTAANVFPIQSTASPSNKQSQTKKARTPKPSNVPTPDPTTSSNKSCNYPVTEPLCLLLTEDECCLPMCQWDFAIGKCSFIDDKINHEVKWDGGFEVGQTHVVKAVGEERHAPKLIAHREAELLFTPGFDMRRLDSHDGLTRFSSQRIESLGTVYLIREGTDEPVLDASAQRLVHSNNVFSLPNDTQNIAVIVDLNGLRLIEEISFELHGDTTLDSAQLGLHFDDGRNQEEDESFRPPTRGWLWLEYGSKPKLKGEISISVLRQQARFILFRLLGGSSESASHWGFGNIVIRGSKDGLSSDLTPQRNNDGFAMTRTIGIDKKNAPTESRTFIPLRSAYIRVAVYSHAGKLIGVTKARDPSKQRGILEQKLSPSKIEDYSKSIWSTTLPYNWVDEGNVVLIGCIDPSRPTELLVHRLELTNLSEFSEHTITRVKLAVFGSDSQIDRLDSKTHEAKRLSRNLFSVMPVAELRWTDTDLWHLPYIVVMGKDGPALVNSEEERRSVTGEGTEISWSVLKNYLTLRHSLAQTGHGFSATSATAENSPYASGTSVFMGWSLSKQNGINPDEWDWEDLGYWDDLAAAAWTGWCILKAGDECSNYFVHEIGHAQTMEHFDNGAALNWGIEDEYPQDGRHMAHHPWGYDTVTRQFRTWFDPIEGTGKLDPLSGAGQNPTSQQCFSQYTPYQAKKAQEWAANSPILLSSSTSNVPTDGAYKFDPSTHQYSLLEGSLLADAVGKAAMQSDEVGIPVITIIGTIGGKNNVCQTYPTLRSPSGNTFQFPDPFSPDLPRAFTGAAYYAEVRFVDGTAIMGLIAVMGDVDVKSLNFFSFNVALHRLPMAVALYRFTDSVYPNVSPQSGTELLHLRPISSTSLEGLPPLLRVGRGWLGDSSNIVLDRFCVTAEDCDSDRYIVEWRSDVASDSVVYKSSLTPEARDMDGATATVFNVPVVRQWDSNQEYSITILVSRFFNDGQGLSPLFINLRDDDLSDVDATHSIRVVAPWELNDSLPGGLYRSFPGAALKIWAETVGSRSNRRLIELNISLSLDSITEAPTSSPSQKGTPGPNPLPIQLLWYIDWKHFTCVNDGESTEWAPAHESKYDCCQSHMAYDVQLCIDTSA